MESRLKLGELAKPVCRVEVDRMVFIPGRVEDIQFNTSAENPVTMDDSEIVDPANAKTSTNPLAITFPAKGYDLACKTSPYGKRWSSFHEGIDLGVPTGTEIVAAWAGKVIAANMKNSKTSYGYYILIQHSSGVQTRYAHLSKFKVAVGDKVTAGQVIALSGATGHVTGPHLHFEIMTGAKLKPIDPEPYLNGKKQLSNPSTTEGTGVVKSGTITGSMGEMLFSEEFASLDWFKRSQYTSVDTNLQSRSTIVKEGVDGYLKVSFPDKIAVNTGFNFKINSDKPGAVSLRVASDMQDVGDIRIYVDQKLKAKFDTFQGLGTWASVHQIAFQPGEKEIRVELHYMGGDVGITKTMHIEYVQVHAIDGTPKTDIEYVLDPTYDDSASQQDLLSAIFGEGSTNKASIQVGQFSYMDTVVLDSVTHVEMDDQFEMDSRPATITISNPKGYYSPDYNPFYFPEMYQETPWSYSLNGYHYGVLSENAPIRIYLGYGNNMLRVYTGLIDKVDMTAEDPQITITCRDMYKKILNKVISEDKEYPKQLGHATYNSDMSGSQYSGTRYQEIIAKSKYWTKQQGSGLDYMFLLAIAKHETAFGTLGAGKPENGSYILGYGVYDSGNKDPAYAGINAQLYRGAKRYVEAMKSRAWKIDSEDDVRYFWQGGDKGSYQWATDTNWPHAVWTIYSGYKTSPPPEFASTQAWAGSADPKAAATAVPPVKDMAQMWVKSSIVRDLIDHADMTGWRAAPNDLSYPDYIIEETYLIELNQRKGKAVFATENDGEFIEKDIESVMTPNGWRNPFVDQPRKWPAYTVKVSDCVNEVIKDTNYRVYCDRYGTFRCEEINLKKPVVAMFTEYDHIVSLTKSVNYSDARSHVVIGDSKQNFAHFKDTELLMDLKGELRSTLLVVPYATTNEAKKNIAERFFWDIKRLSRTLQVSVPGNPALEVLDRIYISDRNTTTRSIYTIKGIRSTFTVDGGYMQVLDLMWGGEGVAI